MTRALPTFEAAGDDSTVARLLSGWRTSIGGAARSADGGDARAGARTLTARRATSGWRQYVSVRLGFAALIGPLPVDEGRADRRTSSAGPRTRPPRESCSSRRACWPRWPATSTRRAHLRREGKEILDGLGRGVGARCDQDVDERDRAAGRRRRPRSGSSVLRWSSSRGRRARGTSLRRRAARGGAARCKVAPRRRSRPP